MTMILLSCLFLQLPLLCMDRSVPASQSTVRSEAHLILEAAQNKSEEVQKILARCTALTQHIQQSDAELRQGVQANTLPQISSLLGRNACSLTIDKSTRVNLTDIAASHNRTLAYVIIKAQRDQLAERPKEELFCTDHNNVEKTVVEGSAEDGLWKAALHNNRNIAVRCLERGASVHLKSKVGGVTLIELVMYYEDLTLELLILIYGGTYPDHEVLVKDGIDPIKPIDYVLFKACKDNNVGKVIKALSLGACVHLRGKTTGQTPLGLAGLAKNQVLELVLEQAGAYEGPQEKLVRIENGTEKEATKEDYRLWMACVSNDHVKAIAALKSGASVHIKSATSSTTPLQLVLHHNNTPFALHLIAVGGAQIDPTPLMPIAWTMKNYDLLHLLSRYAPKEPSELVTEMLKQGEPKIAEYLIMNDVPVDEKALFVALRKGYTSVAAALLNPQPASAPGILTRAAVNTREKDTYATPLIVAAQEGNEYIAKRLILAGADVNARDNENRSALWFACYMNNATLAEYLLAQDAETNVAANPPRIDKNRVQPGIDDKAQRQLFDPNELWPIFLLAVRHGNYLLVEQLLTYSTDPAVTLSGKHNAIHLAVLTGAGTETVRCIDTIVSREASGPPANGVLLINSADNEGRTPLHLACEMLSITIAKRLVDFGADCNLTDKNENTPLHIAAEKGNAQLVEAILSSQFSIVLHKTNRADETAQAIAERKGPAGIGILTRLQQYKPPISRRASGSGSFVLNRPLSNSRSSASPLRTAALATTAILGTNTGTTSPRAIGVLSSANVSPREAAKKI